MKKVQLTEEEISVMLTAITTIELKRRKWELKN